MPDDTGETITDPPTGAAANQPAPAVKADAPKVEAKAEAIAAPVASADVKTWSADELESRKKAIDQGMAALEAKLEKQRQRAIVSTLRKMGADPSVINDADLLALAPKVDPDEPAGLEELVRWKQGRAGLFRRAEVGPQESLAARIEKASGDEALAPHLRERKAKMLAKVYGGGR